MPAKNLVSLAKADGYLIDKDVLSGTTKIFNGQGLEIEFLIQKVGAGIEHSINTNLGGNSTDAAPYEYSFKKYNCIELSWDGNLCTNTGSLCSAQNGDSWSERAQTRERQIGY